MPFTTTMAASSVRPATSSIGGASSGYNTGIRSPTSSVCSYAGSVNSDTMYQQNKYLMKTLCLSKKSPSLPGKAEYANLLTCGLGARKWLASLDFDADSFKAAIVNIYPRLATVSSYSLWNVKPDKTLEKLPCMVNTPKRIKAYLGATFTGSLVIMPSEEISLGPVKVPMARNFVNATSTSSRSSRCSSAKDEKESGYESYQEFVNNRPEREQGYRERDRERERDRDRGEREREREREPSSSSHKILQSPSDGRPTPSAGRNTRLICLTCGRLAKQVGSTAFYDINNSSTFATSDGYVSIAKKLKELFHLEVPRSKIIPSEQICRKCFRALNEIHFLETQLKRSKEEMVATLFSTVSKISRLEQMAREASSSSSSDSATTLGSLINNATLNPWIQEARYALEHPHRVRPSQRSEPPPAPTRQTDTPPPPIPVTSTGPPTLAIFQSTSNSGDGRFMDYNNPQPVFLAPLYPSGAQSPGKLNYDKHDAVYAKRHTMVPLNMSLLSSAASSHGAQNRVRSPTTGAPDHRSGSPNTSKSSGAIYLGKSAPIYFAAGEEEPPRDRENRSQANLSNQEEIEKQMAEEEEAKEAAEREHAATVFLEEAYRRRNERIERTEKNSGNGNGNGSCSSRSSSIMGNHLSTSPGSQSPSPPMNMTVNNVNNVDHEVQPITSRMVVPPNGDIPMQMHDEGKSSSGSNGSRSPSDGINMKRPWKKRYHEVVNQENTESTNSMSGRISSDVKKRARTSTKTENKRVKTDHPEYRNNSGFPETGSSNDPVSTSSGSPDQEEDLMSEASVSPNADDKNGTTN